MAMDSESSNLAVFGILDDVLVQVAGMRVERGRLLGYRLDHVRVTVAHAGNIVIHIQVPVPIGVVHPDAFTSNQVQRLLVEQGRMPADNAETPLEQVFCLRISHRNRPRPPGLKYPPA
jgi:hypothetical protein